MEEHDCQRFQVGHGMMMNRNQSKEEQQEKNDLKEEHTYFFNQHRTGAVCRFKLWGIYQGRNLTTDGLRRLMCNDDDLSTYKIIGNLSCLHSATYSAISQI